MFKNHRTYFQFGLVFFFFQFLVTSCNERAGRQHNMVEKSMAEQGPLYTCSMHPQIVSDKPGDCPICGMTLTKKESSVQNPGELPGVALKASINDVPLTAIKQGSLEILIEAFGNIQNDTRELASISAKISGRIEKLYVRYRYQMIMQGDKIMEIYSPGLSTAQQNLLFLLEKDSSNISLIEAAKQKLTLLGMSDQQLHQLIRNKVMSNTITVYSNVMGHVHEAGMEVMEPSGQMVPNNAASTAPLSIREGMYVQAGQKIFSLTNPFKAWAVLDVFPENQHLVEKGDVVIITPETMPGKAFTARIDFIEPAFRPGNKTLVARVYFDNDDLGIPIGSQVRATIKENKAMANWLPYDAVISLGLNDVVFVKSDNGFEARKVQTGTRQRNQVQIIGGLEATDSVAINPQYLADSDSFIKLKQ